MTKQADLIAYIFEGQRHILSKELLVWMEESSRFTTFVDTYRDKIRKKIRVTREPESALDVRGELEVAYSLLNDRRLAVTYEPYASAKTRGPDFAVTYRDNLLFNVEVARMRMEENGAEGSSSERKVERILLGKLGQMQPGKANVLVIQAREEVAQFLDLSKLMHSVKTRVEGKDPAFYAANRYSSPSAFYKDFLHLAGIVLWVQSQSAAQYWTNKQARPGLDEKVLRLVSSLASDSRSVEDGKQL